MYKLRESDITARVRSLLLLCRIPHWKSWGGGFMGPRGVPDIIGVLPPSGRMLLIEVKRPGGKLSEVQRMFLEQYHSSGALVLVVSDHKYLLRQLAASGNTIAGNMLREDGFREE